MFFWFPAPPHRSCKAQPPSNFSISVIDKTPRLHFTPRPPAIPTAPFTSSRSGSVRDPLSRLAGGTCQLAERQRARSPASCCVCALHTTFFLISSSTNTKIGRDVCARIQHRGRPSPPFRRQSIHSGKSSNPRWQTSYLSSLPPSWQYDSIFCLFFHQMSSQSGHSTTLFFCMFESN